MFEGMGEDWCGQLDGGHGPVPGGDAIDMGAVVTSGDAAVTSGDALATMKVGTEMPDSRQSGPSSVP